MKDLKINNLNKFKNTKLFKRAIALTLSITALGSLCSCEQESKTLYEQIDFKTTDLKIDDDYRIIETKNIANEKNYFFTWKKSLDGIVVNMPSIKDANNYYGYHKEEYKRSNSYIYLNMEDGKVVSVKYDKMVHHFLGGDEYENSEYLINDIISDKPAYNYANYYYGSKDKYTKKELLDIVDDLNEKEKGKQKVR